MAKALVAFYPVAGRLGVDNDGRLEISCNGEGVLFVVARSSLVAEDFDFSKPSLELRRIFVPRIEPPSLIMAIQVTFLKCGGVALGTANNHAAMDGTSASQFMQTWSAFFRDGDAAAIELPCHDRTLLTVPTRRAPRRSVCVVPQGHLVPVVVETKRHQGVSHLEGPAGHPEAPLRRGKHLLLRERPRVEVRRLRTAASSRHHCTPQLPGRRPTTRSTGAAAPGPLLRQRVGLAVRRRCSAGYRISGAVARMDDELVRSAIDYLELADKDSRPHRGSLPETELRIVSWLSSPGHDADFGCGAPQVMSRAESVRGGFVHIMNDGPVHHRGRGGSAVRVVVCMEAANMKELERLLYANIAMQASML